MVSLKQQITEIDIQEQRFHAAFKCYLDTLIGVGEHAPDLTPELTWGFQTAIRNLHRTIIEKRSIEALESGRGKLFEILEEYRAKFRTYQSQQDGHLRSMVGSLATVTQALSSRNDSDSQRWQSFTAQLQETARMTDLGQIQRELELRVENLRETSQAIWEENRSSVSCLEGQLNELQTRLAEAETRAKTDALTGLLNRGAGETMLREGLDKGAITSILMIDLNGFKQINDRWGHDCGDQVLKMFSRNLQQLLMNEASICRWGGDEFLAMRQASGPGAPKAETLEKSLRTEYKIMFQGRQIRVEVSASVGAAEAGPGKTILDLVALADANMYKHKNRTQVARAS